MKKIVIKSTQSIESSKSIIDYKKVLNGEQYKAVTHQSGAALVIAGAGTGKTHTLIHRVAYLVEQNISPDKIFLLTFTKRSAKELKNRITKIIGSRGRNIFAGTFHSFSHYLVKKFPHKIGLKSNFSILDSSDSQQVLEIERTRYINSNKLSKSIIPNVGDLAKMYSYSCNYNVSLQDAVTALFPNHYDKIDIILSIIENFNKTKLISNTLDYDDLMKSCYTLLKLDEEVKKYIEIQVSHVLVDEYQDTNRIQHEISLMIAGVKQNIMAVGDDAQSIYSFRGANFENILFFPASFQNCSIYKIEQNYRSDSRILDLANNIINGSPFKYEKKLYSQIGNGNIPMIITTENDTIQAHFVVESIKNLVNEGKKLNDISVLYRSNNSSMELELLLSEGGIPYQKFGGLKFLETSHIKDLLSFIKVLNNQSDIISWNRLLKMFPGIGNSKTEKIISLLTNNANVNELALLIGKLSQKTEIENFMTTYFKYINQLELFKDYLKAISSFINILIQVKYKQDYESRIKDLETFITILNRYEDLTLMLDELSSVEPDLSANEISTVESPEDVLTLSTIHSAKGLEWDTVFIIDLNEGLIPSSMTKNKLESVEEERRLLYVAITRAKSNLLMSYIENRYFGNELGLMHKSRFLSEIDESLAEKAYVSVE